MSPPLTEGESAADDQETPPEEEISTTGEVEPEVEESYAAAEEASPIWAVEAAELPVEEINEIVEAWSDQAPQSDTDQTPVAESPAESLWRMEPEEASVEPLDQRQVQPEKEVVDAPPDPDDWWTDEPGPATQTRRQQAIKLKANAEPAEEETGEQAEAADWWATEAGADERETDK